MAEVYAVLHRVFQKPADDGPIKDQNQGHPMGADQPGLVQPPVGYIQQAGVPPLVAVPQPVGYIQQVTVPPPVAVRQPVGYNQGVAVPQPAGIEPQAYRANYYGYPAPTNQAMAVPHQPGFYMSPYLEVSFVHVITHHYKAYFMEVSVL